MFYVVNVYTYLIDILQKTLKEYVIAYLTSDMPVMLLYIAYVIMYIISDMPVIDCGQDIRNVSYNLADTLAQTNARHGGC